MVDIDCARDRSFLDPVRASDLLASSNAWRRSVENPSAFCGGQHLIDLIASNTLETSFGPSEASHGSRW
jgi:hypothetical protein